SAVIAATLLSAIKALAGSVMRPVSEAFVDWAQIAHAKNATRTKANTTRCIRVDLGETISVEASAGLAVGQSPYLAMGHSPNGVRYSCLNRVMLTVPVDRYILLRPIG